MAVWELGREEGEKPLRGWEGKPGYDPGGDLPYNLRRPSTSSRQKDQQQEQGIEAEGP